MEEMGMTDKQFNGFLRFIIDGLEEIKKSSDNKEEVEIKLEKMIGTLQKTLED